MDFIRFQEVVNTYKKQKPILFQLEHDRILSEDELRRFEQEHHIKLPENYVRFLLEYGGGYFGYAAIFSPDKTSQFYILHNQPPSEQYLAVADNGCGDYYVVSMDNGACFEPILWYDHETKGVIKTDFSDVLVYLVKIGLKAGLESR